jgi:hypothetical protein
MALSDRSLQARAAAHRSWALTTDRTARTASALAAADARFGREVDPDGILDPRERAMFGRRERPGPPAEWPSVVRGAISCMADRPYLRCPVRREFLAGRVTYMFGDHGSAASRST